MITTVSDFILNPKIFMLNPKIKLSFKFLNRWIQLERGNQLSWLKIH